MTSYIVRRLGTSAITFFLATIVIFTIIQLPPGDYVDYYISQISADESSGVSQMADDLRDYYGLDRPFYERYAKWVWGVVQGDLGFSLLYRTPVIEVVATEIVWTVIVAGLSFAFAWVVGIIVGIISATRHYSFWDHLFTVVGFLGISIPNFFLAMILIFIMVSAGTGITGGLFSNEFLGEPWSFAKFLDLLKHIWMPVLAVGTANMARVIRFMRGNLLEVLGQPYVDTARSKGLHENVVVVKHAVRVAINPLISLAGTEFPKLISGVVITAVVLNLPIMGPTFIEALRSQDMFLAGAYLLIIVVLLIVGNLLADIALAWADPRISYD